MKNLNDNSRSRIRLVILPVLLPVIVLALAFYSGRATAENNTSGEEAVMGGTIKAVVVRSFNSCVSVTTPWQSLNDNWSNYGTTPIYIDYNNPTLCDTNIPITFENLVASGADVVILSDVAGGKNQYTAAEIDALEAYAQNGHNVIGTYLLLEFDAIDNRGLAPLFGLSESGSYTYTTTPLTPTYNFLEPGLPIFNNLGANYTSEGYPYYQIPINDGTWDNNDLDGARFIAKTADDASVITLYDTPNYSAIYITNMPEYQGGTIDEQFIYNAIIYNVQKRVFMPSVLK